MILPTVKVGQYHETNWIITYLILKSQSDYLTSGYFFIWFGS